eukprot:3231666-Pyramimonas_sp.AAC.1
MSCAFGGSVGMHLGTLLGRLGGLLYRLGGLRGRLRGIPGEGGSLVTPLEPSWRPSWTALGYREASREETCAIRS